MPDLPRPKPAANIPYLPIGTITAPDYHQYAAHDHTIRIAVEQWLHALAVHPQLMAEPHFKRARAQTGLVIVDVWATEPLNMHPWWRCQAAIVDQDGHALLDPEATEEAGDYRFMADYFIPKIPPPMAFIEVVDVHLGGLLTRRRDGGPKPTKPFSP